MQFKALLGSRELRAAVLLAVLLVFGAIKAPTLLAASSITTMVLAIPVLIVVAAGQMPVIVSRGVDLSVGSTIGLAGIAAGMTMKANPHAPLILGIGVALAVGAVVGLINGCLIGFAKIPPILTTLGGLSAFRGLTFIVSGGKQIDSNDLPPALGDWAAKGPIHLGAVTLPWMFLAALVAAGLVAVWTRYTGIGRDVFAIGSNPEAARLRGVRMGKTLAVTYTLCGALAGFGGLLNAARYGVVNPGSAGKGFELTVIAAVVIGGCDVRGGSGSILGVLLGCALLTVLDVALSVLHISADWQVFSYGAVILFALIFDAFAKRHHATGAAA